MKVKYLIPPLVFALGLALFILGSSSSGEITLLGLPFHPRSFRGLLPELRPPLGGLSRPPSELRMRPRELKRWLPGG